MATPAPIPWNVSVLQLDPSSGQPLPTFGLSKDFGNWLQTSIVAGVANAPSLYPAVSLTNQSASIGVTPIPLPSLATGLFRITWYLRKTTADGVSSSIQLTISWTESSQALSISGAALATDAVTAVQSNSIMVLTDAASPISYSTTYASNTPATMKYRLTVLVEAV